MKPLAEIEEIYNSALSLPSNKRLEFVAKACGDDKDSLNEVLSLLEFDEKARDFIEKPPEDIAAEVISNHSHEKLIGKNLNHYRVLSLLGAGGMGEVYLAEDTKLGRKLAIKLMPAHFTENAERKQRFEQEARAVSALNHPNIITIYGVEEAGNIEFIATEFIDGKTLRETIKEKPIPPPEAIAIAIQIASALESAHSVGIIHRDIKSANIMIRQDGYIKVLDFGLAKLTRRNPGSGDFETREHTAQNRVMGTISYMSPEQALGEKVDSRTDIFSLGVVLYEMLSGLLPFKGNSDAAIYNATINHIPPSLNELNPEIPLELSRIVEKAMAKNREERYQNASLMRFDLQQLKEKSASISHGFSSFPTRNPPLKTKFGKILTPLATAFSTILVSIAIWSWASNRVENKPAELKNLNFTQLTDQAGEEFFPSLSPDAKTLIYQSKATGNWDIYAQRVGGKNPLNLTKDSTFDDTQAVFSPTGESIAFRTERDGGGIFVMGETGENPRRIADFGFNPSWSPDSKEIAVSLEGVTDASSRGLAKSALWAINVETGEKRLVGDFDAVQPAWSPNGKLIAFWSANGIGQRDMGVVSSAGGEAKFITNDSSVDWNPVWSADGKFLYFASNRGGNMNLWRVAIDEQSGNISSELQPATIPSSLGQHFTFSRDGKKLAYVQNNNRSTIQRIGFNPQTEKVLESPSNLLASTQVATHPSISPDSEWIAFSSAGGTTEDIFVVKKDGTGLRNLTNDKSKDRLPRWSPDGNSITFYSNRNGKYEIWSVNSDGSNLRMITNSPAVPTLRYAVWSPDGNQLAYVFGTQGVQIMDAKKDFQGQTPFTLPKINETTVFDIWSWSPDGKYLVGNSYNSAGFIGGLVTYSIADKTYKRLNEAGSNAIWLNDNRRLLYNYNDKILLIDSKTGKSHEVFASRGNYVHQFELSRDNQTIYYGIEFLEADIWVGSY